MENHMSLKRLLVCHQMSLIIKYFSFIQNEYFIQQILIFVRIREYYNKQVEVGFKSRDNFTIQNRSAKIRIKHYVTILLMYISKISFLRVIIIWKGGVKKHKRRINNFCRLSIFNLEKLEIWKPALKIIFRSYTYHYSSDCNFNYKLNRNLSAYGMHGIECERPINYCVIYHWLGGGAIQLQIYIYSHAQQE